VAFSAEITWTGIQPIKEEFPGSPDAGERSKPKDSAQASGRKIRKRSFKACKIPFE
jgi:hypothetical protein